MRTKLQKLIRLLIESQPSTAATLADQLNVSVRTIKNYVSDINNAFPDTIHSSYDGYRIDTKKALTALSDSTNHIPQTSEERVFYIINKLLNHNDNIILNVYDLCDELYISLSTVRNELNRVRRELKKFDLELVVKGDLIECKGLEKNKRKMLSTILYNESNINFVNIESIQNTFLDIDIQYIQQAVLEIFDKYHYFINDYSLINLVLHITIAVDRIRNNNINNQDIKELPGIKLHEYALAQELAEKLGNHFHIQYSDAEIYEMSLLLISRATTIDYKTITTNNLVDFVGIECLSLVNELIQEINAFYYIDLSEQEFLIRFALHIRNLLVRSKNNYFSKNPLTESIKLACPLIYDASVNLARSIKEKTGITINDDEIAYIAFHLGSALETQKSLDSKITAVLYCPNYYDINLKVTDAINQHFSNQLLIKNILTDESELDKVKDVDLVISTIPLLKYTELPVVTINIFLNSKDINLLKNKINALKNEKSKKEFEDYLRQLIIPEFFERKSDLKTQDECISYMVKKMQKIGYVDASFKKEVLEREKISSTAFGNFAIPHAMKMYAHKTGINIIISDEAISWNGHPVHFVLMMCFNKDERYIFNEIYDPITMILSEPENVKKIMTAENYEQFIQLMVSLLQ